MIDCKENRDQDKIRQCQGYETSELGVDKIVWKY